MSNYSDNKKAVDQFRKELRAMMEDISGIDLRVLNRAMNEGVAFAKRHSPEITGFYRESWHKKDTVKRIDRIEAEIANSAEYASFVNDGHRIVTKDGRTIGYVRSDLGDKLLERTTDYTYEMMADLFEKEVKAVQKRHDK